MKNRLLLKYSLGFPLRILGLSLQLLCAVILFFGSGFLRSGKGISLLGLFPLLIYITVAAVLSVVGLYLYHVGKKMTVRTTDKDPRNPVLYLRSFIDDGVAATVVESNPHDPSLKLPPRLTEEEIIANELMRIGPCVAVGSPRERLPSLGMARRYFDHDDDWQEGVKVLMQKAELVVMRAGRVTPGFRWELETTVQTVSPNKLLIVLPFAITDKHDTNSRQLKAYLEFREAANKILPKDLPIYSVEKTPWMSLSAVVSFQSDWTPKILRLFDVGSTIQESFECISKRYSNYGVI